MSSEKKEKKGTETEIEQQEIQEVEHKTLHPKPDMTRDIEDTFSSGENNELNRQLDHDY